MGEFNRYAFKVIDRFTPYFEGIKTYVEACGGYQEGVAPPLPSNLHDTITDVVYGHITYAVIYPSEALTLWFMHFVHWTKSNGSPDVHERK